MDFKNQVQKQILIFSDGACKGNPGPGGWGALIVYPQGKVEELGGYAEHVTNNQMELTAVIRGLESIKDFNGTLLILTDSSYVMNGMKSWIHGWIKNDWITSSGTAVQNKALWIELLNVSQKFTLRWQHVKAHCGIPGNERVDEIASSFAQGKNIDLFNGPLSEYTIDPFCLDQANDKEKIVKNSKVTYLSLVNGSYQEDSSWKECEARVKGVKGAKFKKAKTNEEILKIKRDWGLE